MKHTDIKVLHNVITDQIGTVPKVKEVHSEYVQNKLADNQDLTDKQKRELRSEELACIQDSEALTAENKGWTGFFKDDIEGLWIPDYMIKGFLKSAAENLQACNTIKKIPAYLKWFDRLVHVYPRRIYLNKMEPDNVLERPIRVKTPTGDRVALAKGDIIEAGSEFEYIIRVLDNNKGINKETIEDILDFGQYVGLGQWRGSGGYGRFTVTIE